MRFSGGIIFKNVLNALKELFVAFVSFRESAFGVSRYHGVKRVSFRSRTVEISVNRYGLPRYLGKRLVRVL